MTLAPTFKLNSGAQMPALGFGVYKLEERRTASLVATAINNGYRLIDTAAAYGNEKQTGEGIRNSGIPRDDVFLTTKLWISDYGREKALSAFNASMEKLGFDYLDLYLLHWPAPSDFDATLEAWMVMIDLQKQGQIGAIGTCNFNPDHLEKLIERSGVTPAVNQIELHPGFGQASLRSIHDRLGIVTQAWSPIGGVYTNHPADASAPVRLLDEPKLIELAEKNNVTPAQLVLRWHFQNGVATIPKSGNPDRIASNFDIWNLELSAEDMAVIDAMEADARGGPHPDVFDLEFLANR